jgi:hypothetical protein
MQETQDEDTIPSDLPEFYFRKVSFRKRERKFETYRGKGVNF